MKRTSRLNAEQIINVLLLTDKAVAIYTTQDIIIEAATDAMIAFWGKDRSVIGKPLADALPELDNQPFVQMLQNVLNTGIDDIGKAIPANLEVNGILQTFYFDYEYRAIRDKEGNPYCIFHTAEDVTDQILARRALDEAKESQAALTREQELNEELAAANEELSSTNEEMQVIQGILHQLNANLENRVAERTRELADREARLRYMLADAPVAIAVFTGPEHIVESANAKVLEAWGKTSEIIGLPLHLALPELEGQPFLKLMNEVYNSGNPFYGNEVKAVIKQGKDFQDVYSNFVYHPLKNESGDTTSIMLVAHIVTEQVMARKKVEASEQQMKSMIAATPMGMSVLNGRDFIVQMPNASLLKIWDRTLEEVDGKPLIEIFPELMDQPFPAMLEKVYDTGMPLAIREMKADIATKNGMLNLYVDFVYTPLMDATGAVSGVLVAVQDITDIVHNRQLLERSEEQLQELNEELSATNEELAATNEELLSSNEELASTQNSLQNLVQQLVDSESRFRFLLNAIPQQVWTATPDGAIDYVNQIVSNDFGRTAEEIVGSGWQAFIHPDDLDGCLQQWAASLASGTEYMLEFRLLFRDGEYRWHLSRAVPLIEDGKIVLWLGTNTNISVQKNNEKRKDEFLSIASHELKTPITSLKASLQLLNRIKEKPDSPMLPSLIEQANKSLGKVSLLVEDLLNVSKVNEGQLALNKRLITLSHIIDDCCAHVRAAGEYTIVTEGDLNLQVVADGERIDQVIINFVNNSIKYAPRSKTIRIVIEKQQQNALVSVIDEGPGISSDKLPYLFDRYYRADTSGFQYSGLGLGLYICAEIIKKHHGQIGVESKVGKGSRFWFTLPIN